jgi:hypothetical protein
MIYKPIINYIVAAGIALSGAFSSRTAVAEESSPLESVVCTYDSVQGSLCSSQPPKNKSPKPLTCEQKCEQEYKRVHERNCGKDHRALQEYRKELERSGSRLGISWPFERYSNCLVPINQNRRLCLDACEEGQPARPKANPFE